MRQRIYIYIIALQENHFLIKAIFSILNDTIHVAYRAVMRHLTNTIENTNEVQQTCNES